MSMVCFITVGLWLDPGANSRREIAVFCGALAAIGFVLFRKNKRGTAVLANQSGEVSTGAVEAAALRLQRQWGWLLQTSPPREFQLTRAGLRNVVRSIFSILIIDGMLALGVVGNYWLLHKQHGPLADGLVWPLMICCIVVGAIFTVFFGGLHIFYHRRARRLLGKGEAVVGKIVKFEAASSGSMLNIEFPHPSGKVAKARSSGRSEAYFEGMTLPVFCNPLNLEDSFVFQEGGDYEISRPGLSSSSSQLPQKFNADPRG
jgi:hypothetical protein